MTYYHHVIPIFIFIFVDTWTKEIQYHKDLLANVAARISNENLRINKVEENDLFGTEGTFRKINID